MTKIMENLNQLDCDRQTQGNTLTRLRHPLPKVEGNKCEHFTHCKRKKKCAFTLAEVLIVLGIIGVVAALTIPTLINSYEKQANLTAVKKAYSTLTQGFQMMMADTGCSDLMCTGYFDATSSEDEDWNNRMEQVIKKTFKTNNIYKYGDETMPEREIKYLKGTSDKSSQSFFYTGSFRFVMSDGMTVKIYPAGCEKTAYSTESKLKNNCAGISVDTNGLKGPNTFGKDVFADWKVSQDGTIYPATSYEWAVSQVGSAAAKTHSEYWPNSSSQCAGVKTIKDYSYVGGPNCLARIIDEGWQITYY